MDTKKENPPHKSNVPLASFIAILTGITSLLIFLTGKSSLPDLIKGEPPTATASPTTTVPGNPTVFLSPTPTDTKIPEATSTRAFVKLTATPPTDLELDTVPSLWTLTHFRELAEPGVYSYSVEVTQDSEWLWDCYFCTKNENFQDFMDSLNVEFLINDVPLEEGSMRIFDKPGILGWLCRNWSTVLSGWPAGRSVFLEIHFTHSRQVSDGRVDFPAGEYSQLLVVVVTR
ncbi:MAG: hypothetical protein WBM17_08495 [Anaerolineales bacterium]